MPINKIYIYSYFVVFLVFTFLSSCNNSSNSPQKNSDIPSKNESSGQIINKYVETLTTAKDKAKKAAGAVNERTEGLDKSAQEIDVQ